MMKTVLLICGLVMCDTMVSAESVAPKGWMLAGSKPQAYTVRIDPDQKHEGANSVSFEATEDVQGMGTLMQSIKADDYRGKRVRFSGYARGQGVAGWAGLWMRADSASDKALVFDNTEKRALRGDSDWKPFDVVFDIPKDSAQISFGMLLSGKGHAWFSGLDFKVVDRSVQVTAKPMVPVLPKKPVNLSLE